MSLLTLELPTRETLEQSLIREFLGLWTPPQPSPEINPLLPPRHLLDDEGRAVPFHLAQEIAWNAATRYVALIAGTQGGKTKFAPVWLHREIFGGEIGGAKYAGRGGGDYLAVTATYDLFKMKMLPAFRLLFEEVLNVARYWASSKTLELRDPDTGLFLAQRADDRMWGRIILRSADALSGLESGTVKAMVTDEAGMDTFKLDAWKALQRRGAIYRARVLLTTTLYNLDWVKNKIIDRAEEGGEVSAYTTGSGGEVTVTSNPSKAITLIQYDSIVNPMYDRAEFEEARAENAEDDFDMFWRGLVTSLRLNIYNTFDETFDTCDPFQIPFHWHRYWGFDFGGVNLAVVCYAERPDGVLVAYREYHSGNKTIAEHAAHLLADEPIDQTPFHFYGGAASENQWRMDFGAAGIPIQQPAVSDVSVGIQRVYAKKKKHEIIYFKTLKGIIGQNKRYRRKRDRAGNVTSEIENKAQFHFLDAERYIVSSYAEQGLGAGEVVAY